MSDDMPAKKPEPADGNDVIELSDGLATHLSTVATLSITPTFSVGTSARERQPLLVPILSCSFHGSFGAQDSEEPIRVMLSFDNLAFILKRLGDEYVEVIDAMESVSQGPLSPSKMRIEEARDWLDEGAATLGAAAKRLGRLAARIDRQSQEAAPGKTEPDGAGAKPKSLVIRTRQRLKSRG